MKLNEEIKKNNPFKVPDGYFETLAEKTMAAIRESEERKEAGKQEERPVRKLRIRSYIALAAAIACLALMTTIIVRLASDNKEKIRPGGQSELYTDMSLEELDTYMIENELNLTESSDNLNAEGTISADAIIDYLIMENIDVNDIYELL